MSRPVRVTLISVAIVAVSALAAACGTERIDVPKGAPGTAARQIYTGAVLFSQRCAGCHTLSYAATHGSASNVRTAQANNGPNFNVRCERPAIRVLYAIENGGFSGAIMPQNVVVGQQAIDVAKFVAQYAGRQSPKIPGAIVCRTEPIGTLPSQASATATSSAAATSSTAATGTTGAAGGG